MAVKHSMDLTKGSVMKNLIIFAVPIMLSNLLQQLYHAADVVVVGNFASDSRTALAAVGSTGSITTLLLNLFLGLSVGTNVVCANLYGAKKQDSLRRTMYSSLVLAAVCGIGISIAGFLLSERLLLLLGSPDGVRQQAARYMQIIFIGQPANLMFNFGSGILRAHGDTKRPLYILSMAGILNVCLNVVLVKIWPDHAASGVAIATIAAWYVSAAVVLWILFHPHGEYCLRFSELRIHREESIHIAKVGIPCGLNGIVFSLSNVIILSAFNELGDIALAANSAASSVDAILFQIIAAFYSACVSFAGQNYGAKRLDRIDRLLWQSILIAASILFVINVFIFAFPDVFMRLFANDDLDVIAMGGVRLKIMGTGYMLYTVSEMAIGCLRGMGKSVLPMILNASAICIPRILWVLLIFPLKESYPFLLLCYPISWVLSSFAQLLCYFYYRKKERALLKAEKREEVPA